MKTYAIMKVLILIFVLTISATALNVYAPPGGGGGGGGGGGDGGGPPGGTPPGQTGGTTTVVQQAGGVAPPIKLVIDTPKQGDIEKRGLYKIIVEGYEGGKLDSNIDITAESELFGKIGLVDNFEGRGSGSYGANVIIGKNATKRQYLITIKGRKSTYDEQSVLINVDPTIYINTTIKKNYMKGERISFEGTLFYFNKTPANNTSVKIHIAAADFAFNKTALADSNGNFNDSYLISFAEPDGKWSIKLIAEDNDGNEAQIEFLPHVSTPEGVAFYTVTFLSPLKDAEFKRGVTVPITVEIRDEENPVENATVDFRSPKKDIVNLKEVRPGTYSTEYRINFDDPLGIWKIGVQAIKTKDNVTKAGGNRIPVNIRFAGLSLDLLSPLSEKFFTGEEIEILADLTYDDRSKVENADVVAKIGNNTVKLIERAPGRYSATYLYTEKDVGTKSFQILGRDIYGNDLESSAKAINIEKISGTELQLRLFYYNVIARYWYAIFALVAVSAAATKPLWYRKYLEKAIVKAEEERERVVEMEKDTQLKYFKDRTISRSEYEKLMGNYKERLATLKERKVKAERELKKTALTKKEKKN